jgi:hypothetical protein
VNLSFQPAWTLIELIKSHAELHAVEFSSGLETFANQENQINSTQCKAYLVEFVASHIKKMLDTLYKQIHEEEERELPNEESAKSFEGVERHWFINLYQLSVEGNQLPQSTVTGDQQPQAASTVGQQPHAVATGEKKPERCTITVVGPLGERPLHVCALSRHRFGAIDFEGQGNYFAEGIEKGIQAYIKGVMVTKDTWKEVTRPYGKDYCAAVGDFIRRKDAENKEWGDFSKLKDPNPPFWVELKRWYSKHFEQRLVFNISKTYSEMLVTRGLYEGETILLPFIAEHNEHMVGWLLDTEEDQHVKEWRNSEDAPR